MYSVDAVRIPCIMCLFSAITVKSGQTLHVKYYLVCDVYILFLPYII